MRGKESNIQLFCLGTLFKVSPGPISAGARPERPLGRGQKSISTNRGMLYIKLLEILCRFRIEMETYAQNLLGMSYSVKWQPQ